MPRALLFFNARRGQCQKRRRLKVITRRLSAEVRSSGVSLSEGTVVLVVGNGEGEKEERRLGDVVPKVEAVVDR